MLGLLRTKLGPTMLLKFARAPQSIFLPFDSAGFQEDPSNATFNGDKCCGN